MARWFRVYDDLVDDPKVQCLAPELFRSLVNLWCIASRNKGRLPAIGQVAFSLRVKPERAAAIVTELTVLGLLDETPEGFAPHNWASRQFKSDTSNERVAALRERRRNGESNVTETAAATPPESETDTESEKRKEGARARAGYSMEFQAQFWAPYPRTPVMSKAEAWRAWQKASAEDRAAIIAAVPRYAAWLRSKPDHPAVHACRFISQRRFEGFGVPEVDAPTLPPGKFYAKAESSELIAWDRWSKRTRGKPMPRDKAGGWLVDSPYPPNDPSEEPPEPTPVETLDNSTHEAGLSVSS